MLGNQIETTTWNDKYNDLIMMAITEECWLAKIKIYVQGDAKFSG